MKKHGRFGLQFHKRYIRAIAITLSLLVASLYLLPLRALATTDYEAERLLRLQEVPSSNLIPNWPVGPQIGAQSAILMDVASKAILYEKNKEERLYPASVTKLLTALVVMENCNLDDMVTFSPGAIGSINFLEDSNIGARIGDSITVEQALYALLVASANEVALALAETVSGPGAIDDFCALMNEYAASIGCKNSHFTSPNGLFSEDHYTTAYDLALIASRFYSNELLSKMSRTASYKIPQTATQSRDNLIIYSRNQLLAGKKYAYEGLVGSKTGYTDVARQILGSCAEKNGLKLICIVMKEEAPYQYEDTVALFDYGFNNFYAQSIATADLRFSSLQRPTFSSDVSSFGSGDPILQVDSGNRIILPVGEDMEDVVFELSYEDLTEDYIARINYYYNDIFVGFAGILPAYEEVPIFNFMGSVSAPTENRVAEDVLYINVVRLLGGIIIGALIIKLLLSIISRTIQGTFRRSRFYSKHFRN